MPQSVQTISPEYYQEKYEKRLLNLANKENLWERFMLGEKMDKDLFLHTFFMIDKVCPINCEVYNFIWDKIEGNLKCDYQTIYQTITDNSNVCSIEHNCNTE